MTQINIKEKTAMDLPELKTVQVNKRPSWTLIGVLGLCVLVLVLGATIAGVFIGKVMTKETYEEAWAHYYNTATNTTLNQRFIVDGQEVSIIKPGEISVVLDYQKNQVVMHVDGMRVRPTNDCLCFVYDLDTTKLLQLNELVQNIHEGQIGEQADFPVRKSLLEISETLISLSSLSKRSVELCDGCKIFQASLRDNEGQETESQSRRIEFLIVLHEQYSASDGPRRNKRQVLQQTSNFDNLNSQYDGYAQIQKELMSNGPVQIGFTVYKDFFSYSDDVYG